MDAVPPGERVVLASANPKKAAEIRAIVGDAFYGATTTFGPPELEERERPIALHARRIQLRHPMSGAPLDITAPLPETWRGLGLPLEDKDYIAP
mgnify:CR=1 FL=1